MVFQKNATLISGIEKVYSAKFRRKIKLKKNIEWENAKGECFCNTHLEMHEKKNHVVRIYSVSFLVSYPRGISPSYELFMSV